MDTSKHDNSASIAPVARAMEITILAATDVSASSNNLLLIPDGQFCGRDGRPRDAASFVLTYEMGERMAAEINASDIPLQIDYEHQSIKPVGNGPVPTAGWIKHAEYQPGRGLVATDVEWTKRAQEALKSGEYRYLSPVILHEKHSGRIWKFISAALVNVPAIVNPEKIIPATMRAELLSSYFENDEEKAMSKVSLLATCVSELGLPESTSEDGFVMALLKKSEIGMEALKALRLDEKAEADEIETAVAAL